MVRYDQSGDVRSPNVMPLTLPVFGGAGMSVAVWAKWDALQSGNTNLWELSNGTKLVQLSFRLDGGNRLRLSSVTQPPPTPPQTNPLCQTTTDLPSDMKYMHLAFTLTQSSNVYIYINGGLVQMCKWPWAEARSWTQSSASAMPVSTRIAQTTYWDRALLPAEIATLASQLPPALVATVASPSFAVSGVPAFWYPSQQFELTIVPSAGPPVRDWTLAPRDDERRASLERTARVCNWRGATRQR
jgi:hypothetical protein